MSTKKHTFYSKIYFFFGVAFTLGLICHLFVSANKGHWIYGLHWQNQEPEVGINALYKLAGVLVLSLVSFGVSYYYISKSKRHE